MKRSRDLDDEDDTAAYGDDAAVIFVSKFLNLDTEMQSSSEACAIQCSLPGHARGISFTSYHEYERHYIQAHSNRCLECGRNFPTLHILGLHIQEYHDALAEMKREHGASTYACFLEACEDKFKSHKQRKEHLIREHAYPHNYFFAVTKFGIDRRQSMLVEYSRGKSSQNKDSPPERWNPQSHGVKPAVQSCDTTIAKDVQMTDAEKPVQGQHEAVEHIMVIKTGTSTELSASDARKSSLAKPSERQSSHHTAAVDADMEGLTGAMSSLQFVPRAVRMGPKPKARR